MSNNYFILGSRFPNQALDERVAASPAHIAKFVHSPRETLMLGKQTSQRTNASTRNAGDDIEERVLMFQSTLVSEIRKVALKDPEPAPRDLKDVRTVRA